MNSVSIKPTRGSRSVSNHKCSKMVQLRCCLILVLFLSQSTSAKQLRGDSKKFVVKTKGKLHRLGEHFQCDLVLLPEQRSMMYSTAHGDDQVGAYSEDSYDSYKWPKNKDGYVVVPYRISRTSQFSAEHKDIIRSAMNAIERETCVRFRPHKYSTDFVNIFSGRYCKSNLGKTGGQQDLSLNYAKCLKKGIVIHELLHALGFIHMHNRPNRDKYVNVVWKNIDPKYFREFERVHPRQFNYYGTAYDYESIMHYSSIAFSKNGGKTIIPKDKTFFGDIGHRSHLSQGDIRRINNKYNCDRSLAKPSIDLYSKHNYPAIESNEFRGRYQPPTITDDDDDLFNI